MNVAAKALQLPFTTIVYATDFSACSENAGKYTSCLAAKFGAELLAAHSFVLTNPAMKAEAEARPRAKSAQRIELEAALAAAVRRATEKD